MLGYLVFINKVIVTVCAIVGLSSSASFAIPVSTIQDKGVGSSNKTQERNILAEDLRLDKKITLDEDVDSTIGEVFRALMRDSDIRLKFNDDIAFMKDEPIRVRFVDIPLRDAMDAIAALHQHQWQRVSAGVYALRGRKDFYDPLIPKGEEAIRRAAIGKQFLDQVNKLTPEQQKALTSPDSVLTYSDLPQAMQGQVRSMLDLLIKEHRQKDAPASFSEEDDLAGTNVRMQVHEQSAFTSYIVYVSDEKGMMGWSFNDFEERQKAADHGRPPLLYNSKDHTAIPDQVFGKQSEKPDRPSQEHEKLQIKITIEEPEATPVSKTATALANRVKDIKGNGSYVIDIDKYQAVPATVSIKELSIAAALKKLIFAYPETEWEFREGGVLVVRGRSNGARQTKE